MDRTAAEEVRYLEKMAGQFDGHDVELAMEYRRQAALVKASIPNDDSNTPGDGRVECPTCNGLGLLPGNAAKCPDCSGDGRVTKAKAEDLKSKTAKSALVEELAGWGVMPDLAKGGQRYVRDGQGHVTQVPIVRPKDYAAMTNAEKAAHLEQQAKTANTVDQFTELMALARKLRNDDD